MNIKGFTKTIFTFAKDVTESRSTQAKLDADNNREGNGQSSSGEEQKHKAMTLEEVLEAVKQLENLPGVKESSLTIRLETADGINIVYVEDRDGNIVRRIPESELATLSPGGRQKRSGNIFNKAV